MQALARGFDHIYLEKPGAPNVPPPPRAIPLNPCLWFRTLVWGLEPDLGGRWGFPGGRARGRAFSSLIFQIFSDRTGFHTHTLSFLTVCDL